MARGCAAAISLNFFPDRTGRFYNFSQFHSWNHSKFHFLSQKIRKNTDILHQFHVKLTKKKRFLAKTNQVKQCVALQSKANQASKATQAIKAKQSKQTKAKQAFQTNEPNQSKISKQTKEKRKPSQLKANKG